jgi:hypothetical protein
MNVYRGIQALLSFLSDALITLSEATARDKAEQQVARISASPAFCLGIQASGLLAKRYQLAVIR